MRLGGRGSRETPAPQRGCIGSGVAPGWGGTTGRRGGSKPRKTTQSLTALKYKELHQNPDALLPRLPRSNSTWPSHPQPELSGPRAEGQPLHLFTLWVAGPWGLLRAAGLPKAVAAYPWEGCSQPKSLPKDPLSQQMESLSNPCCPGSFQPDLLTRNFSFSPHSTGLNATHMEIVFIHILIVSLTPPKNQPLEPSHYPT